MSDFFTNNHILIESLKRGDALGYTYLVDFYHQKLCIYAYGFTRDYDLAEDIVQNVFIRTWKKRENLKTDFSIQSFLYKSVYNEYIDQYRKQRSIAPVEKMYMDALTVIVEEEENESLDFLAELVKKEIQHLPEKCRETFLLSKEEGLTNNEIAEYKKISLKTVEAHMSKAFNILRKKIARNVDGILFFLFRVPRRV